MELTWLFVVLIIIAGLTVLLLLLKPKLAHIESFGGFKEDQLAFGNNQYSYYHNTIGKEILVNPGIDFDRTYASIQQPGTLLRKPQRSALAKRFKNDPHNKFTDQDKKFCRSAKTPASLPSRPKKATIACGWWFVSDPSKSSTGALGSREKPMFPDTLPGGGEWIWDIKTATKKEEIKRCKRIKNCNLIGLKELRGVCGFCPDKGVAVPVNSSKKEKYPEDTLCGTEVAIVKSQCPVRPTPPVETPEGVSCGNYGSPSADGSKRVYTKEECAALDSNAKHENDECLKPNGGSYNWDCRELNAPNTTTTQETAICEPDASGKLTRPCLLSLSQGMGFTKAGTIVKMLMNPSLMPSEMDVMAIQVLGSIGVSVPNAVLGAGDIDADSASNVYYKIMSTANSSTSELYKEAAAWLTYGSDGFDPCSIPDETMGPFVSQCIHREFRKAGCQPAGSEYPGSADKLGKFAGYSWGDVKREFSALFSNMSNGDGDEQDKAVSKCLGIGIKREPPISCKIQGMWQYNYQKNLTIRIKTDHVRGGYDINWRAGTGTADFDEKTSKGMFNLISDKTKWNIPFTVNGNTLMWSDSAPFTRVSQ